MNKTRGFKKIVTLLFILSFLIINVSATEYIFYVDNSGNNSLSLNTWYYPYDSFGTHYELLHANGGSCTQTQSIGAYCSGTAKLFMNVDETIPLTENVSQVSIYLATESGTTYRNYPGGFAYLSQGWNNVSFNPAQLFSSVHNQVLVSSGHYAYIGVEGDGGSTMNITKVIITTNSTPLPPEVVYDIFWDPVSMNSTRNEQLYYHIDSNQTYFFPYQINVYYSIFDNFSQSWGSETYLDYPYIDGVDGFSINYDVDVFLSGYLLNSSYWNNKTFYLNATLSDSAGVINWSRVYSLNESINYSYPQIIPTPILPNITAYPYPTYVPGDVNVSINGTNASNIGATIRNQSGVLINSTNTVWGISDNVIGQLRTAILNTTTSIQNQQFTVSQSILGLCRCLITSIHWKVKAVMIYSLTLITVLIIMGKR